MLYIPSPAYFKFLEFGVWFVLSFRLLRPGGLLCFDDYLWRNDQRGHLPREAIDAFLGLHDRQVEVLERGYQVWGRVSS